MENDYPNKTGHNLIARFQFCKKYLIVNNLRNQTVYIRIKRLDNGIFVKSNIELSVEFTNATLSRKFVQHGTSTI